MRALVPLGLATVVALVVASAAEAGTRALMTTPGAAPLSLERGVGRAVIARRGSLLGNVARGRLRVTRNVSVRGCEVLVVRDAAAVCRGRALRFFVFGGTWRVRIRGRGINVSGVARGYLRLAGRAGRFSIEGGSERRWPATLRAYRLGAD